MPSRGFLTCATKKRNAQRAGEKQPTTRYIDRLEPTMNNIVHRISMFLHKNIRHQHFPAFNVSATPLTNIDELQHYPSCSVSTPQAIHVVARHTDNVVDLCHRRTLALERHRVRLLNARTAYHAARQANRKVRNAERKCNVYPTALFDLAERLECKPDPFLHGCYDYYYSGGNLCLLPAAPGQRPYIVHVDDENLQRLNISELSGDSSERTLRMDVACTLDSGDRSSEVFEVCAVRHPSDSEATMFAARQLNSITLYSLLSDERQRTALTQLRTSGAPLIGFAQLPHAHHRLAVSSMTQQLRVYDLESSSGDPVAEHELRNDATEPDVNWNALKPWRDASLLYANERSFCVADLRCEPAQWQRRTCLEDLSCAKISALCASAFDQLLYVATSHKLHCFDVRYAKANAAVSRWTHQLEYPPAYLATCRNGRAEIVALASALAADLRICELTEQLAAGCYQPLSLPYQPPTLREAYDAARLNGACLQREADLPRRLRCCTTGLAFECADGGGGADFAALLLTANSIGDVFAASVLPRATLDGAHILAERNGPASQEIICRYAQRVLESVPPPPLHHTEVVDFKVMGKVLQCQRLKSDGDTKPLHAELPEPGELKRARKRQRLGRWQKSIATLHSYRDALAEDLLAVWNIDYVGDGEEEEAVGLNTLDQLLPDKHDTKHFVGSWLNETPMVWLPTGAANATEDAFLNDCETQAHSTQLLDNSNCTSTAALAQKSKTKKKTHVKGF